MFCFTNYEISFTNVDDFDQTEVYSKLSFSFYLVLQYLVLPFLLHVFSTTMKYLFQVVHTQTTTVFCRILPTMDHHVSDAFFV